MLPIQLPIGALLSGFLVSAALSLPPVLPMHQEPTTSPTAESSTEVAPGTLVAPSNAVMDALLLGDTKGALEALAELDDSAPGHQDAWAVYRAEALERSGDLSGARKELEGFEDRFPDSPWVPKARFQLAELHRALGEHGDAESILRPEASALRSDERRVQLGHELVAAAEALEARATATPTEPKRNELRTSARLLLGEAHKLETSDSFRLDVAQRLVHLALARSDQNEAAHWVELVAEGAGRASILHFEASLIAARLNLGNGGARRHLDVERALAAALSTSDGENATLTELHGFTLAFLGDAWTVEGRALFAVDAWQRLIEEQPTHPESGRAAAAIARAFTNMGRHDDALEAWERVRTLSSVGAVSDSLAFMTDLLGYIEQSSAESRQELDVLKRRALFERALLQEAIGRYGDAIASHTEYVAAHPGAEDWNAAQQGIVSGTFGQAITWLELSKEASRDDLAAAEAALQGFAAEYPLDERAGEALYRWATLPAFYGETFTQDDALAERKELYRTSVLRLEAVARGSVTGDRTLSSRALFQAAEITQNHLEDPQRAISLYQRVSGDEHSAAIFRLREMQDTILRVKTPGLARPGQPISIEAHTQNIEEITVQAVRLDLGQYFLRHGTTVGIDRLDLDLIAPDFEKTLPVEGYEPFAGLVRTVEVPIEGDHSAPGVYAVTVIAEGKRATTLAVRSNLDMIVKRADSQVFVLVTEVDKNSTPKVAEGVDITVSYEASGKRETVTLRTDAGGVASIMAPEGTVFGDDTHVFATKNGHVAATHLEGSTGGQSLALSPRGHLQLDRSAYRPGEEVSFRAVLRDVRQGEWQIPSLAPRDRDAGYSFTVELAGPNGVVVGRIHSEEVSEYGTLQGTFELDAAAPSGQWTLIAKSPTGVRAQSNFTVGEIEVPRVALDLSVEESVVMRGERVTVEALASTAWGAPLSGAPIVWYDPQGTQIPGTTDDAGRATLVYETEAANEGEQLTFQALLPEEGGIGANVTVQVALAALAVTVELERDVVLAGETFLASIAATAPDGKTLPTKVRVVATRTYSPRPGRFAEERIFESTVTTDAAGRASIPISSDAGGALVVRASADDRFGREVTAECHATVSGTGDAEALRVLSEDATIVAGQEGRVRVVDRSEAGGFALMTIEASTVLEHRVLSLKPGVTELSFTANVRHVPDVLVSISAIRGQEFYERSATFRVTRPLELQVEAPTEVSPGGTAEVVVRATDGLGQPVRGELSLALVDQALLRAFPMNAARLADHFAIHGSRTPAFITGASSTFRYDAETVEIDAAILEEGRRSDAKEELEAMLGGVASGLEDSMFDEEVMMEPEMSANAMPISAAKSQAPRRSSRAAGGGRFGASQKKKPGAPQGATEVSFDNPTAFWTANVVTDAQGVAKVTIPMPTLEATWQLDVAGVTKDHRFGSTASKIVTSAPIVAVLGAPGYLNEGDEPQLRGEIIVDAPRDEDTTVEFELRVTGLRGSDTDGSDSGGASEPRQSVQRGTAVLPAGSARLSYTFDRLPPIAADGGLQIEFVASLQGQSPGTASDTRGCIVRPEGYLVADTAAGRTQSEERVELALNGVEIMDLTLIAGATEAQWLVDAALGGTGLAGSPRPGAHSRRASNALDVRFRQGALAIASQLFGSATLLDRSASAGGLHPSVIEALGERADGLIGALISRVSDDGGWGFGAGCWRSSAANESDVRTTALAIVALTAAQKCGRIVPDVILANAVHLAETMLANADSDGDRALLCWALESTENGNDLVLNRLHRERTRLDTDTLAPLAMALVAADKMPMAAEVASLLTLDFAALRPTSSRLERVAFVTLARASANVEVETQREALLRERPWVNPVGCGLGVAASAAAGALQSSSTAPVTFEVTVDGGAPETVQLRPKEAFGGTRELSLSLPNVGATSAIVTLRSISGPAFDYALLAEGFAATPPTAPDGYSYSIDATTLRGPLPRWRGRPLEEGFSAVVSRASERWEDTIEGLAFGAEGRISVHFRVPSGKSSTGASSTERSDFFIEMPLPAGVTATVAASGGHGTSSAEIVDGSLLASIPRTHGSARVVLDVVGTRPGRWTLPAPTLRSALNPGIAIFGESRQLIVYAPGAAPEQASRPTPDERLSHGRQAFADEDMAAAIESLGPLYQDWKRSLRPAELSETARLLLFATLKEEAAGRGTRNEGAIVDWFEILKERDPSLFISFDDTLRIAAAYTSIGEPLRANLLYRAIIDETLGEDLRVAAAMDQAGDWMRASQMAAQIWRRYPDSPAADDADLALAGRLIERGLDASGDHDLGASERSALTLSGMTRLRRKVALGDKRGTVAADAGLALVTTYAQLKQWSRAAERSELFGRVIEDPIFRDSFRYSEAVARWSDTTGNDPASQEERAVKILQEIATKPIALGGNRQQWSPNRDLAVYILAQVYHARKDTDQAAEHYARIENAFADARAALSELRSERLTLEEEVVRVRPGEVAKIRFDHKGIDGVDVLVYPVDLMTLAIRERDLSRVTAVDLAGVTPTLEESVVLDRSVLRPSDGEIEVSLNAPGAYLAMLRGGDVHRSALLLATDLDLDVVLPGNGSVRAQAMLASTDSFAEGASVRIIGESIESLETDRRGVAAADGMQGRVTVIARSTRAGNGATPEQHYAFYGSTKPAGPENVPAPVQSQEKNTNYLSNVLQQNFSNTAVRQQRFEDDIRRTRKGVQVQQAK